MYDECGNFSPWEEWLFVNAENWDKDELFNSIVPRELRDEMFFRYFITYCDVSFEYIDEKHVFCIGKGSNKIYFEISDDNSVIKVSFWKKYKKKTEPDIITIFMYNKEKNAYIEVGSINPQNR